MEDAELLRRYAESRSEEAFAELVRRRIGLVYSIALRQTRGDAHGAKDATQAVFTDLARKAATLAQRPVLAGWLCRSAQFAASDLMRAARRRAVREHEAHLMQEISTPDTAARDWEKIRPALDEVLNALDERDRDAIVLRYFDGRPFAEIGERLRLTENAARMRVERALEKLRARLVRRGVTSTHAALAAALAHQAAAAVPAGLAGSVTGVALAAGTTGGGLAAAVVVFMSMNKLPFGIAVSLAAAGLAAWSVQARETTALARDVAALRDRAQTIATLRAENLALARAGNEVEQLREDNRGLPRLRGEAAMLRQRAPATLGTVNSPTKSNPPHPPVLDDELVTIRLPDADLQTVLSVYQIYIGKPVRRDASLTSGVGIFNVKFDQPVPKREAMQAIRSVLELNGIVLETEADGSVRATRKRKP